jgi:2-polyprenyl-3-methyl-5-hydroxy-6-metoxy-1,4-benzoquinol methylase
MNERPDPGKALLEESDCWDREAAQFDDAPDHGLRDPAVLAAWTDLLKALLPGKPGRLLDVGCGTGSLSVLLAGLGHQVTGVDLSPEMIALARHKAAQAGHAIRFYLMDAARLLFPARSFETLICRHLLWALPDPGQVLAQWADLLSPGGILVLVEGFWHTQAGLHAEQILATLPPALRLVSIRDLSDQPALWGGPVSDERYAVVLSKS